jgi:hypothetical protein
VAAVALTATPGIAAASPVDRHRDSGLVSFPLLAVRAGGGHAVLNGHYSHYSHSSHSSHVSHYSGSHNSHASHYSHASHSSHFSASPSSPPPVTPTPVASSTTPVAVPTTVPPAGQSHHAHRHRKHHHHRPAAAPSASSTSASPSPTPTTSSPITSIRAHNAANDSGTDGAIGAGALAGLVIIVIGGVTYVIRRRRPASRP